jgi:hypothetical protein
MGSVNRGTTDGLIISIAALNREVAYMQEYPYLECKSEGCHHSMPLPQSSQLGKYPNLPGFPKGEIFEIFVNPECGHVCDYTELDVRWRPDPHVAPDRPERPISFLVEWNCDVENCDTRTIIQRPTRGTIKPGALMKEAREKWNFCLVHCPKGHLISHFPEHASAGGIWVSDRPAPSQ